MSENNGTMTNAAGTPPPSNPSLNSAPPPSGGAPASDWTSGLNDEMKGYVQSKGFKDASSVLESYKNSESLIGKLTGASKDRVIGLPDKEDDPKWNEIYNKLGRPEKADGYKIPVPQGDSGELAKKAAEWFHEAGLTQKQAEKIAAKWNETQAGITQASTQAVQAKNMAEDGALKEKWGAAYDQNIGVAKQAVQKFGVTADAIDALEKSMGYAKTMEFFQNIGSGLGEHAFVSGDTRNPGFSGAMTPEQARSEIQALRQDPQWVSRFIKGGHEERATMDKLTKFASPGSMTL